MSNELATTRTVGIIIIATLTVIAALYLGAEFLAPIAVAVVLCVLLRPLVRWLKRVGLPAALASAVVVIAFIGVLTGAGYVLAAPARTLIAKAPEDFQAAGERLNRFLAPVKKLSDVAAKVQRVAQGTPTSAPATQATTAPAAVPPHVAVAPSPPGGTPSAFIAHLAGSSTQVAGGVVEVLLLLYLLLSADGLFFRKLERLVRTPAHGEIASAVVHDAETVVLRYVMTTAMINLGQSTVIVLAMWWLQMPAPLLWGVFTFILEFVPYLGALVMIILLASTALATFDNPAHILAVPGVYLLVSSIQNNLISPLVYGRGLKLNPVAVLIGVIFWWFIWGIPGAFLAVPILAMMKVAGDRIGPLRPVGEILGD